MRVWGHWFGLGLVPCTVIGFTLVEFDTGKSYMCLVTCEAILLHYAASVSEVF